MQRNGYCNVYNVNRGRWCPSLTDALGPLVCMFVEGLDGLRNSAWHRDDFIEIIMLF